MTFKAMVESALAEIEIARNSQYVERLDLGYDICHGFEIFTISKESSHCIQFFDKDKEFNVYHCLYRVKMELESRDERLVLAIPGGKSFRLFRPNKLPCNRLLLTGPFDFHQNRNRRSDRCVGMLVKDFEGNVFLTNSSKFNSKNVKSAINLGLAVIDNYKLTEIAESNIFYYDYYGIGMRSNGDIIIVNAQDYKENSEWANVLVANDCCDAAIIYSPTSEYFLRNRRGNDYLKTFGGFIGYALNKKDIRELIWDELSLEEKYKYYLLSR
ncbi:MAG: hypothetical protein NWS89_02385 [Flavobacteriales bacterium]|nr:hypothetical protein [Flavobacteriales bacterium]